MNERLLIVGLIWIGLSFAGLMLYRWFVAHGRTRRRLHEHAELSGSVSGEARLSRSSLRAWLVRAGIRSPRAPMVFLASTIAMLLLGAFTVSLFYLSGLGQVIARGVEGIPGGVGQVFLPLALLAPWLAGTLMAAIPLLVVRVMRRSRVQSIERDLPMALELMATLSEAGLAFDAALSRVMETRLGERPLAEEFRRFQADLMAGRPRSVSLRRMSQRIALPAVSIFVSALVQADQVGMGIARVLRQQADDLRGRRRERANAFASALPVKRVVPMVICFLPGLFVWTLGPFFVQLFQLAETFVQVRGF